MNDYPDYAEKKGRVGLRQNCLASTGYIRSVEPLSQFQSLDVRIPEHQRSFESPSLQFKKVLEVKNHLPEPFSARSEMV
jgi:hypothetical protein